MVQLRKILFAIFIVLYLILCPTLILYSLGIMIKPGGTKNVIKTGVIYISSIPPGASVSLNGKPKGNETPAVIDNLLPGTYNLELIAAGYRPWSASVRVFPEQAIPLDNVLLIPNFLKIAELSVDSFNTLIPAAGNPYLITTRGPQAQDVFVHIWDEGITQNLIADNETKISRIKPLFPTDFDQRAAKIAHWYTINNSSYLFCEIEINGEKRFLWIDPLFGTPKIEDLTELFPVPPEDVQWSTNGRHLLSFQNNSINRIDIATKAIYPRIIDHTVEFSQIEQNIIYLTEDGILMKANANGGAQEPFSTNALFNDLILHHFPFKKISAVSENVVVLLGKHGEILSNLKPYLLAEEGIVGFKWNPKPDRLLLWSNNRIGFIDFSKDSKFVHKWIAEGVNIADAFWVNDGTHILFVDGEKVLLADTGCCGRPGVEHLIDVRKDTGIYYSDRTGKALFINKDNGRLNSVEILPQKSLITFDRTKKPERK